ncbi:MAG: glycosyltransferase family 4 protein [Chloroflexi bacterium]|nr:glycosyltransferase family 4 protein [Chloroflexota bacterium]MXX83677.1 glycosyltransferase family 4 protein [Chloroflexota bacterium]MYA92550.1 glycosyltransferase family 4 protein [Chloroflexota bacterium]MYC54482.1 glycosyltransferase family 4 protein [Chloroflexota bacterium]MYD38852.1 glycosyltransferase family 4 protein [Chloroflexota bacterium]
MIAMKILLLNDRIPPEGKGGAEAVVWRLAVGLRAAGHQVHIAAATEHESFDKLRDGIETHHLRARYPERFRSWLSLYNPQTARAFQRLLGCLQPDVVNAHNVHTWMSWHSLRQARDFGCRVVFSGHDCMPVVYGKMSFFVKPDGGQALSPTAYRLPRLHNLRENRLRYNPFRNPLIRRALGHAQAVSVPSQALADVYAVNGLPPAQVVPNGIDLKAWTPVQPELLSRLRGRFGLEGKRVILFAGRLTRGKGVEQLLAALDRLRDSQPNARLLALSSRSIESQVPARFRHLLSMICSAGWLEGKELRAAFQLADVVAVPSIYLDTFPTVNLEAMALGRPVIATCFGGSRELVQNGETGYIINPFDSETFAQRLQILLADGELRARMGRRGRERVAAHYRLEQQVAAMIELYKDAL